MRTPFSNLPLAACCFGNPHSGGAVTKNSRVRESIWDAEPKRSGDRHARSRVPAGLRSRQNRLIEVAAITRDSSGAITGVTNLVSCQYDRLARLVARTTTAATTTYLYDGWNHIVEYSIQNSTFTIQNSYLWGLDLSGSLQGAGGVGGLVCIHRGPGTDTEGNRTWSAAFYPTYDGNGNISEYLDKDGTQVAHFEYDPFGRIAHSTGSIELFSYRFSTKPWDPATGWFYYGYRWYDPLTGRWKSRDPIEEGGGLNLYGFSRNNGIGFIDRLGLSPWETLESLALQRGKELARQAAESEHELKKSLDKMFASNLERIARSPTLSSREVNLPNAINALRTAFGAFRVATSNQDEFREDRIFLENYETFESVVHETVHAFNSANPGISRWDNEGMAYGMEKILNWADRIIEVEEASNQLGSPWTCRDIVWDLEFSWRNVWDKGVGRRPENREKTLSDSTPPRPLTAADYSNIRRHLGTRVSCETAAAVLNESLAAKSCCVKFSCDAGPRVRGAWTYGMGYLLYQHDSISLSQDFR